MLWFKYPFFILFSSHSYYSYANIKYAKSKVIFFLILMILLSAAILILYNIYALSIFNNGSWGIYIFDAIFGIIFLLILFFTIYLFLQKNFWSKKYYFLIATIIFILMFIWELVFMWYWSKVNNINEINSVNLILTLSNVVILFLFIELVLFDWFIFNKTKNIEWKIEKSNFDEINKYVVKKDVLYWNENEIINKEHNIIYVGSFLIKRNDQYSVKNIFSYESNYYELIPAQHERFNFFCNW